MAVVKAALGITDTSEDVALALHITRASAAIATACNRVLVSELVEESLRSNGGASFMLERYPVCSITSVSEAGAALTGDDYEVDADAGIITRLRSDKASGWASGRAVIRYRAGYSLAAMPPDLVQATIVAVAQYRSAAARDPLLRSESTGDVESLEWQIATGGLPGAVLDLIASHRKPAGC
ncbi:hypothetical protein OO17_15125 [Rhodopseudomonas palustris]|uniref:Phage gp6-like head-tail connector protein n=1 Tax=Rhodopseudomonas palustris TaxID=1076 RepID=A0A0D7ELK7_RHOPL|nr:hypothetical protein OO17_15125 [Rhodopseudomonas palustris]